MENDLMGMIGQVGFPIAVSAYVLIRLEGTMRELTRVVSVMSVKMGVHDDAGK